MAKAPKQAVLTLIAGAKRQNFDDKKIMKQLLSRNDIIGQNMRTTVDRVGLQQAGAIFGLKLDAPGVGDKVGSFFSSIGDSATDSFGGVLQLAAQGGDYVNKKINNNFGTKLETNATAQVNKDIQSTHNKHKANRQLAGKKSTDSDTTKTVADFGLLIPAMMTGGGEASLLGRMTGQALQGAALGAAHTAKDGNERMSNMAWGAGGGALGQGVGEKVLAPAVGKVATNIERRAANKAGNTARAAESMVDDAIAKTGLTVTSADRAKLVSQATKALSKGKQKDAPALVRKLVLDNHGIKGTQAQITRNPNTWANERELAKHNAPLNQVHIDNHQQLDGLMKGLVNDMGANPVDTQAKMKSTIYTLNQVNDAAKTKINGLYETARTMNGSDLPVNHNNILTELETYLKANGESDKFGGIKSIIEGKLNPTGTMTLQDAEAAKQVLNRQIASTTDGSKRWALGEAKNMIDKHIDDAVANDPSMGGAKQAWIDARTEYRNHAQAIDNNPALRAAIDGAHPDDAFNKFVLNGKTRDLGNLVQTLKTAPNGQQNIKDLQGATIEHFLGKATQANTGAFSPSQLNRAIDSFGDNKLKMIFTPEQISRLNDIRQVSDILVQQPLGAHVNHSNTANVVIKQLLGLAKVGGAIPYVGRPVDFVLGGAAKAAELTKGGQALRMMNGEVPIVEKNSLMGLTPAQLKRIGISKNVAARLTAATGVDMGN